MNKIVSRGNNSKSNYQNL